MDEEDEEAVFFLLASFVVGILLYLAVAWSRDLPSFGRWALVIGISLAGGLGMRCVIFAWRCYHRRWVHLDENTPNVLEMHALPHTENHDELFLFRSEVLERRLDPEFIWLDEAPEVRGQGSMVVTDWMDYAWVPRQDGLVMEEWKKCVGCGKVLDRPLPPREVGGQEVTFRLFCCACYHQLEEEEAARQVWLAATDLRARVETLWEDLCGNVTEWTTLKAVYEIVMVAQPLSQLVTVVRICEMKQTGSIVINRPTTNREW